MKVPKLAYRANKQFNYKTNTPSLEIHVFKDVPNLLGN